MPSRQWSLAILAAASLTLTWPALAADELRDLIDREIAAAWKQQNITPAVPATEAEFFRRIHLDLHGVVPGYEQSAAFLADTDPAKRQKLIDRLLDEPQFADAQAVVWDQVLFGRDPPGGDGTRKRDPFVKFLRDSFAAGKGYDKVVRELLLAEGNSAEQGAPLFLVQYRDKPEDAAVAVTRLFLGVRLDCARCHDHPTEDWSQREFFGMAAFFSRLKVVELGKAGAFSKYAIGETSTGEVLFSGPAKDQKPGTKGEPVKPRFLGGPDLDEPALPKDFKEPKPPAGKPPPKPAFSRKEKLADWVTSADNPYFARAAVNRIWAQFMGRGLVDPVDDFTPSAIASHPVLLSAMTEQFREHQFDFKWLIRQIVNSKAYQLSSAGASAEAHPQWFERARVRPLSAEELLASLRVATGADVAEKSGAKFRVTTEYFTRYFGEPLNGRGVFQGSIDEHLFLNNSSDIERFTQPVKGNLADWVLTTDEFTEAKVERMFLSVLARKPDDAERAQFVEFLKVDPKEKNADKAAVSQAIWVLLNTAEFRFNH